MSAKRTTIGERLFWAYSNLAMADMAVGKGADKYKTLHFMIRAKLNKGLTDGTMNPRTLMKDQKVRMKLPQECVYCGSILALSIDHIIPTNRGGSDTGDNAVWACRSCNSSKSDRDLFEWWASKKQGFPPLFLVRVYLKQAILYFTENNRLEEPWSNAHDSPFDLQYIPETFPPPSELIFTRHHPSGHQRPNRVDGRF
jgi:hypothetical protein